MSLFDFFRRKDEPPPAVKRIYKAMQRELEGKTLAEQALSHRALGNYGEALVLLHRAVSDFDYTPALALVGTTLIQKGDIKAAIDWFSAAIEEQQKRGEYPLIELYANLGSIYSTYRKQYDKAIELYEKALAAPRPPIYGEDYYALAASNVHRDMAIVYAKLGDLPNARKYAEQRLAVDPDCAACRELRSLQEERSYELSTPVNRLGVPAGEVRHLVDGRVVLVAGKSSDYVSILLSIWQAAWNVLREEDKRVFLRAMGLSEDDGVARQREVFSHAMLHWFVELKKGHASVPEPIGNAIRLLPECVLPPLPRPLSDDVRRVCLKVSVGQGVQSASSAAHPSS